MDKKTQSIIKTDINFSGIFPGHPPGSAGAEMEQDKDRGGRPLEHPAPRPEQLQKIKPLLTSLFFLLLRLAGQ